MVRFDEAITTGGGENAEMPWGKFIWLACGVGALALVVGGCVHKVRTSENGALQQDSSDTFQTEEFEVRNVRRKPSQNGQRLIAGELINRTDRAFRDVKIEIHAVNEAGASLGAVTVLVPRSPAGDSEIFEARMPEHDDDDGYEVRSVEARRDTSETLH